MLFIVKAVNSHKRITRLPIKQKPQQVGLISADKAGSVKAFAEVNFRITDPSTPSSESKKLYLPAQNKI